MNYTLHHGDSRDVLAEMPDASIDAVVCDPPYALVSIVKRFGSANAAPAKGNDAYARASAGFMGKSWDTGEVAFAVEFWAECLRVLKPGGHVVAFSGTRTYHRMACAIEDAGFEIRDQLQWLYGTGFPKSHDVSKAIDKRPGASQHAEFASDLKKAMKAKGYTNTFDVAERVIGRRTGAVANWQKYQFPKAKWWPALRDLLEMDGDKWDSVIAEAEREVVGKKSVGIKDGAAGGSQSYGLISSEVDITKPATPEAEQWEGWGTALKPANEPICLARKPLSEKTVALNVLKWGTGALNIDACRIEGEKPATTRGAGGQHGKYSNIGAQGRIEDDGKGRFPANVITDGSVEMPNGAQRFFYSAKASKADRGEGNNHPTVKPTSLMQWLCGLVTPPGGIVLDPFMGSGSTGKAAVREGFRFVGIEREAEYFEIAKARLGSL